MKCLGASLVCIGVLYGLDATLFGGWYFTGVDRMLSQFLRQWL